MAVTWNKGRNLAKITEEGDVVAGRIWPKYAAWYATGASAGTTKLHIAEDTVEGAEIWADVAESANFMKLIPLPDSIDGFKVDDLDAGYVLLCIWGRTVNG